MLPLSQHFTIESLMPDLLSHNPASLKMLFTEDIYSVKEKEGLSVKQHCTSEPEDKKPDTLEVEPDQQASYEYLGDNNKYFLVLHDDKIHTGMNPVHKEMLLKVMAAKKLELRDLAIVNISRYPNVKFNSLKSFFSCTRVTLFGIQPSDIGLQSLNLNKEQNADNVKLLATYSLEDMRNNADKKREFWNVMKTF